MEVERFKQLYKLQDKILNLIKGKDIGLYLTGGTALHRFHYNSYRYSEDLDFFNTNKATDFTNFIKLMKNNDINFKFIKQNDEFLRIIVDNILKIDLVKDNFPHLDNFLVINDVLVDNKNNILSNKLNAVIDRTESRDIYDIYILLKNNNFEKNKILKNLQEKTSSEIDDIFYLLKSFPINNDNYLNNIYFMSKNNCDEFKSNYSKIIDDFINIKPTKAKTKKTY